MVHQIETKGATESPPVQRVPATRFTKDINNAINFKQVCLPHTELKVRTLENSFNDDHAQCARYYDDNEAIDINNF